MNFDYTLEPGKFVESIEAFSDYKLKRKVELLRLYEEVQKNNDFRLFEDMVFNAKYIMGLLRVVKSSANIPEIHNIEQIKKDFSDNMEKIVEQLKTITRNSTVEMKEHFEDTYLKLSQEGFLNLSELLSDLEQVKKYLNEKKRI